MRSESDVLCPVLLVTVDCMDCILPVACACHRADIPVCVCPKEGNGADLGSGAAGVSYLPPAVCNTNYSAWGSHSCNPALHRSLPWGLGVVHTCSLLLSTRGFRAQELGLP